MTNTVRTLEEELEMFKLNWGGIRVSQYPDSLVYKVAPGWGRKAAESANRLIESLKLNLRAESNDFPANDGFFVEEKK